MSKIVVNIHIENYFSDEDAKRLGERVAREIDEQLSKDDVTVKALLDARPPQMSIQAWGYTVDFYRMSNDTFHELHGFNRVPTPMERELYWKVHNDIDSGAKQEKERVSIHLPDANVLAEAFRSLSNNKGELL